jgi:tetratricopeptide (TPR) repeat protein
MFKQFLLITPFLITHIVCAQQTRTIKEIDELITLGHSLKNKNTDSVLLLANIALTQSRAVKYELGIVKAMTLVSFYYYDKYKFDTAKFLLNESLQYFTRFPKHQNSVDHGQVFLHFGYVAIKEFNNELALKYATNALEIFRKEKDLKLLLPTLTLLGSVESDRGNYAKGLAYYSNVLRLKIDNNYPEENCISEFTNIGGIYIKIGQHEKAIQYSKKSLALSIKYNHTIRQLATLNNLGTIYSSLKEYDSAIYYYNECLKVANSQNKNENKGIALYNIANLLHKTGQFKKSHSLIRDILETEPTIDIIRSAEILLAKNYYSLGKIDTSIYLASSIYKKIYTSSANKESIIELTSILSKAFSIKKKYDSALYYLMLKHTLTDSMYNIVNQRKLGLLYAELENVEKEKEIELLQKESEVRSKANNGFFIISGASVLIIILLCISLILFARNKERNTKIINSELNRQLEKRKRDLHQQTLKIIYMNNGLVEIESSLKKLQNQVDKNQSKDIDLMLETIENSKTLDTEWDNFTKYFDQVYDQFTQKVSTRFPNLSTAEKRLILLIKMELKNREIASLLNIDSASVKMAKYRLKKKLHLPEEIDVQIYLNNFN